MIAENPFDNRHFGLAALGGLTYTTRMSDSQAIGERIRLARQETGNLSRIAAVLEVGVEHLMFGDDKTAPQLATRGHELAMLRLYRDCAPADQQLLLRTARRLVGR